MAISLTRYVDIVSSVGAGNTVARRSLIGRIFDSNELIPSNSFLTFTSAADVLTYFGVGEEYNRALAYFGWISKNGTVPQSLDYARWNDVAQAAEIYGKRSSVIAGSLAVFQAITAGTFGMTIAGVANTFSVDFTTAVSLGTTLPSVASLLQADIQAAGGAQFATATVTYDAIRGSFQFVSGVTGPATISVQAGVGGTPIAGPGAQNILGWYEGSTLVVSDGNAAQTPVEAVQVSAQASNNFGSFLFIDTLSLSEVTAIASWNNTQNVMFMYLVPVTSQSDATNYEAALNAYSGTGIELSPIAGQYVDQDAMQVFAATNYDAPNSVQNYMFQIFPGQTASVSTDADANFYDALRVNYYGVTQTAGQYLAFFQRGNLMGGTSAPIAMNVYANEVWLKDAMGSSLMTLLSSQSRVPANSTGQSQILSTLQGVIDEALNNGTISANKILTASQKAFITSTTGDDKAWYQVQNSGYWVSCQIVSYLNLQTNLTEYKAVYTLVYSKDDTINLITGQQILI